MRLSKRPLPRAKRSEASGTVEAAHYVLFMLQH